MTQQIENLASDQKFLTETNSYQGNLCKKFQIEKDQLSNIIEQISVENTEKWMKVSSIIDQVLYLNA